jgi:hypothetical protein
MRGGIHFVFSLILLPFSSLCTSSPLAPGRCPQIASSLVGDDPAELLIECVLHLKTPPLGHLAVSRIRGTHQTKRLFSLTFVNI